MVGLYDKKQMTEEDIKLKFITPAITKKWDINKISMETPVTYAIFDIVGTEKWV